MYEHDNNCLKLFSKSRAIFVECLENVQSKLSLSIFEENKVDF